MKAAVSAQDRGVRATMVGLILNSVLVVVKLVAGIVGTSGALVADGIESSADIFSSLIVWKGLRVAGRAADKDYHFGYGKAESVSAAVVSMMLVGASLAITINAIREIITPHHLPATFTLYVLAAVIVIKEYLYRRTLRIGKEVGSVAVTTDAWHHRADAITSTSAFIGIAIAIRGGPGWEQADDWAALVAALMIALNGVRLLRPAIEDLMDRAPSDDLLENVSSIALTIPEVRAIEKLRARKTGTGYFLDMHIESDPAMSLHDAHIVSGKVKSAIRREIPGVQGVLIHMEPHEPKAQ